MSNIVATHATSSPTSTASRVARLIAVVSMVLVGSGFILVLRYAVISGDSTGFIFHQALLPISAGIYLGLGVLIISHQPGNWIGWIFLAVGALYSLTAIAAGISLSEDALATSLPPVLTDGAQWLSLWIWMPAQILPTTFVFLLFPDGRLLSPRWRPVAWASGLGLLLTTLALALHPGPLDSWALSPNPYGVSGTEKLFEVVLTIGSILLAAGAIGSIVALVVRFRQSTGIEREQMKWLAYAAASVILLVIVFVPMWYFAGDSQLVQQTSILLMTLTMLGIAVAATMAIVRYHLYDIDLIINRTVVYGLMTAVVILIYGLIVGGASVIFQTQSNWVVALVATGLVAVLFQPIRERLQRSVNRLLYGQRDEPYEVLSQLGQQLELTISPEAIYPTIVETVSQALRLPYAAIQVKHGRRYATVESVGVPVDNPGVFDLTYQGALVGRLLAGRRSPDEAFSAADERLLRNIARQAGAAVYDAQLTADLRRSRQEVVTNREEERRRLRRDLHDGIGPSLASLHLEAGVLRRMIRDDPDAAVALVEEMQGDIRLTIDDLRRVVYELRPPALDDLGLVGALQVLAAKITRAEGKNGDETAGLTVTVEVPDDLPPLPAAVEVAAYRIVQEAVTNVVRHAQARHCFVNLSLHHDALHIEISDDGRGLNGRETAGVGLMSISERAAELGGRCEIETAAAGGTRLNVTLPLTENSLP